jgi:hypothetical protein
MLKVSSKIGKKKYLETFINLDVEKGRKYIQLQKQDSELREKLQFIHPITKNYYRIEKKITTR